MNNQSIIFDSNVADAQGSAVNPLSADRFDADAYSAYAKELEKRCAAFASAESGVLVHRRFRVPEVFSSASADMKTSLELQLGALEASRAYPMDVPNFLEPWYGIGYAAAAFGAEYLWPAGQAPAVEPVFANLDAALAHEPKAIADTPVGRHILSMIDFFLESTGGKVPLSCSDVQSPLNATTALFPTSVFFMDTLDRPDDVAALLERVVDLSAEFFKKQVALIGDALVRPGHGFASSRHFRGLGASDDNSVMVSPDTYRTLFAPALERFGAATGGTVFHSCGNWSTKIPTVLALNGLVAADAALTVRTDPDPNPPEAFRDGFSGTGVTLNARMVGSAAEISEAFSHLYSPKLKTIVVTYCASAEEQRRAYESIHERAAL
ncbi:MAG: uroporphyrinogen decarboxylase family protein [Treponemataceae bacterium]